MRVGNMFRELRISRRTALLLALAISAIASPPADTPQPNSVTAQPERAEAVAVQPVAEPGEAAIDKPKFRLLLLRRG